MTPEQQAEAARHIAELRAGNFEVIGEMSQEKQDPQYLLTMAEPYHLWRLIEMGQAGAPALYEALSDDMPTSICYEEDSVSFMLGRHWVSVPKRHATIGDLADYALRRIYDVDAGYRSYRSTAEREAAIRRWRKIIIERSE
jgi:hypothetical protein